MNELMMFDGNEVEVFELDGRILFNAKNVADILGIRNVNDNILKMNENQSVKLTNSIIGKTDFRKLHNTGENFLTESGVYKLIMRSNKPEVEKFQDWVTDEVIPSIRKNGGYIANQERLTPEQIVANALVVAQNIIDNQKLQLEKTIEKLEHKQEVINGLTENISVTTKRDILNRVVRYKGSDFRERYNELYRCFRETHHIDLKARTEGYNLKQKKIKDKLSVVKYAEHMGHVDKLYDIACSLYESDVNDIKRVLGLIC